MGTTLVSGISHYKFKNIDWRVLKWLTIPGAAGALSGAIFLSNIDAKVAKPFMSGFLFCLGAWILLKYGVMKPRPVPKMVKPLGGKFLIPLGLAAGFLDAAGGGGWGPLGTSSLMATAKMEPRKVVGTVDTSEFLVTVCASIGFVSSLGTKGIKWSWVLAILIGGVLAAPAAAWLVHKLNTRVLGTCVSGVILLTNLRTILEAAKAKGPVWLLIPLVFLVWAAIFTRTLIRVHHEKQGAEVHA
jgi:hypothetical protein